LDLFSPETAVDRGKPLQAFTAIEQVVDGEPYQIELTPDFAIAECFPIEPDPPKGVISLQHGFPARGPWYRTPPRRTLAKETNSIVVTPTLTSDLLQ
jgi:hypothetical protein